MFTTAEQQAVNDYVALVVTIDEDNPGLLIGWNLVALVLFVASANAGVIAQPQPVFVSTIPGTMTVPSIMHDVVAYLAQAGSGGSHADILLAPNTLQQYANVQIRLTHVELDSFVQAHLAGLPAGATLATTFQVTDRTIANAVPCARVGPPAPHSMAFA